MDSAVSGARVLAARPGSGTGVGGVLAGGGACFFAGGVFFFIARDRVWTRRQNAIEKGRRVSETDG